MIVNIVTGANGSCGRTLMCLSAVDHYLAKGDKIVAFDANMNNNFFARYLPLQGAQSNTLNGLSNIGEHLLTWDFSSKISTVIPFEINEGLKSKDYWNHILTIAENERKNGATDSVIIVDTAARPGLFLEQKDFLTRTVHALSAAGVRQIYFWYIWSVPLMNTPASPVDSNTIREMEELKRKLNPLGLGQPWRMEFIHVFNLDRDDSDIMGTSGGLLDANIIKVVTKLIQTAFEREETKRPIGGENYHALALASHSGEWLEVSDLRSILNKVFGHALSSDNTNYILEIVVTELIKYLGQDKIALDKLIRPNNLFLIPYFSSDVASYHTKLAVNTGIKDFAQIRRVIKDVSESVSKMLSPL